MRRACTVRALRWFVPLLVASTVSGCGWRLMPTPIAFRSLEVDDVATILSEKDVATVDVFYVTDRAPGTASAPVRAYTNRRGLALRLGRARVRIGGAGDDWATVARRSIENRRPPMTLVGVDEYGPLWTTIPSTDVEGFAAAQASQSPGDPVRAPLRAFVEEINDRLATQERKDVVVYVPGFNTAFQDPIMVMAQYAVFMGRTGVYIAYSWPSSQTPLGYSKQILTATVSSRNLRQLLFSLAEETDAERIHVISYSAGAPIVSRALLHLRLLHADKTAAEIDEALRIGNVIYAGADEDLDYFRNLYLDQFDDVADRITIYTSRIDIGLLLSRLLTTGSARLGRAAGDLTKADVEALRTSAKTFLIDVTDAKIYAERSDIFRHAYWYLNSWVNMDVITLLVSDADPEARGLHRDEDKALWSFPRDYPDRIREIMHRYLESLDAERSDEPMATHDVPGRIRAPMPGMSTLEAIPFGPDEPACGQNPAGARILSTPTGREGAKSASEVRLSRCRRCPAQGASR